MNASSSSAPGETIAIGFLLFPNVTQLDLTGPYEVLSMMPGAAMHLVGATTAPLVASGGLIMQPTTTYDACPPLDVICVPGGTGMNMLLTDPEALAFLRRQAETARYVTSVCTGALVLGAAGLLRGKRAATHWMSMEFLPAFGAIPVAERVVVDGNIVTGGGVTAGIDFGLRLVAELRGEAVARAIQLAIEYDPEPPFEGGHPRNADPKLVAAVQQRASARQDERRTHVEKAVAALKG